MLSQPQVRAYTTDHIIDHASHWEDLATRIRSVWKTAKAHSDGVDYHGPSAEKMRSAVDTHHDNAHTQATQLDTAAKDARNDAVILSGQQRSVLNTVDETAAQQGFSVGEGWEVTDEQYPPGSMAWIARVPDAEALQATLAQQLAVFTGQEYATGVKLSQHAATLSGQAVMTDFKTDGMGSPPGGPLISPDPSKQGEKKPRSFGDNFDSFAKVVGGAGATIGGIFAIGAGAATEVGTDGISSPISIPTIAGGATAVAGGAGSIEKGLNELFGSGQ